MTPLSENAPDDVRLDYGFGDMCMDEQLVMAALALVREATPEEDYKECVDTTFPKMRFARRNRRISTTRDRRDLTIRAFRRGGSKTEYQKLMDGSSSATHFIIGWFNAFDFLVEWVLIDVNLWRRNYGRDTSRGMDNRDSKTGFYYWPLDEIGLAIIKRDQFEFSLPTNETIEGRKKCSDCWQNRDKWHTAGGRIECKVCKRFIGYVKR